MDFFRTPAIGFAIIGLMIVGLMHSVEVAGGAEPRSTTEPDHIAQALQKRIKVEFDRSNFDSAMGFMATAIGIPIEVDQKDVTRAGLTKSNSFSLNVHDVPAGHVLQICLAKTGNENLIYVLRHGDPNKPDAIIITSREAAKARGEKRAPAVVSAAQALQIMVPGAGVGHNSLQLKLELLAQHIGVPIEILTDDVDLMPRRSETIYRPLGTRRRAVDLLHEMLLLHDPTNELCCVIKSKPSEEREMIFITTRYAAEKRGERILPEFAVSKESK